MRRLPLLLCFVLILSTATLAAAQPLTSTKPEDVGLSSERLGKIAEFFNQQIAGGSIPGGVVMIARRGRLAYAESFGFLDKDKQTPMASDAIFRAYSMTKPLVSV